MKNLTRSGGLMKAQREAMALLIADGHTVLMVGCNNPTFVQEQLLKLGVDTQFVKVEESKYFPPKVSSENYSFSKKRTLPKYVSIKGSAMRLKGNEYWKDGGLWGVHYYWDRDKLLSIHPHEHLNKIELIEITEEEWRKGN